LPPAVHPLHRRHQGLDLQRIQVGMRLTNDTVDQQRERRATPSLRRVEEGLDTRVDLVERGSQLEVMPAFGIDDRWVHGSLRRPLLRSHIRKERPLRDKLEPVAPWPLPAGRTIARLQEKPLTAMPCPAGL
jgi:hypothetical protein